MDSVVDFPVRQAGRDHNIEFPAMVLKMKPAIHLLDICPQQKLVRLRHVGLLKSF